MSTCVECGVKTSRGAKRCAKHRGEYLSRRALLDTRIDDKVLLQLRADGLSARAIGTRLGVSRVAAGRRLQRARLREERRKELGL